VARMSRLSWASAPALLDLVRAIAARAGLLFCVVAFCVMVCAIATYLAVAGPGTHLLTAATRSLLIVDYGPDDHVFTLRPLDTTINQAAQNDVVVASPAAQPGNEVRPPPSLPTPTPRRDVPVSAGVPTETPLSDNRPGVTPRVTIPPTPKQTATAHVAVLPAISTPVPTPTDAKDVQSGHDTAPAHPAHDPKPTRPVHDPPPSHHDRHPAPPRPDHESTRAGHGKDHLSGKGPGAKS
jgi:hypothetical protein